MRADELVLRTPIPGAVVCWLLILSGSQVAGLAGGSDIVSPVFRVLCLVVGVFPLTIMIGQWRTPPRLSPEGIHAAPPIGLRYHPTIPWDMVGRIWTDGPTIRVRLRDPDAAAGADHTFRARMRRNRNRYSADLLLPLLWGKRYRPLAADAVSRFSGGRLRLERALVDPVPGNYDVAIPDNRVAPRVLLLLLPAIIPWAFASVAFETGASPLIPLTLAVAVTVPLVILARRLAGPLVAPHIIAPDGLRVRVANPRAHDLRVPWAHVDRIWHGRLGRSPVVLVLLDAPDALAGGDERLRARMRRNRARTGADVIIPTAGSGMDEAYLAIAVAHRSNGTRELEHVA
ncbi:hypothetical protein J2S43_005086 [Catenuloplanes nepalensis]|uniref:DUF58 domain-containing protein n=1 Tax=Catenuloplanes nepalensis TaxID=587533 RepID=A0ABT9MYR2_9ACTN|nr:hypothetical protein [Catenuloplanes nepalensis]MDP9796574.1 hypothetical protein [Catenuloplanes nepalensis]